MRNISAIYLVLLIVETGMSGTLHIVNTASLIHVVSMVLSGVLLYFLYRNRGQRLSALLGAFMAVTFLYSFFSFMRSVSVTEQNIVFWANMRVAAMCFSPVLLLRFCMAQTVGRNVPRWVVLFLVSLAVLNLLVVFTDGTHHFFRESVQIIQLDADSFAMKAKYGEWFYGVYLPSIYIPVLFCLYFYLYAFANSGEKGRIQYAIQFFSVLLLVIAGLPLVTRYTLYDTYGMALVVFIVINHMLLSRYGFLDVVAIAKQTAFDVIDSAVLVFGPSGRLLDMNGSAKALSSVMPFDNMYDLYGFFTNTGQLSPVHGKYVTKKLNINGEDRYFSAVFHKIADLGDFDRSCIATVSDVTEHHRLVMMHGERERLEQKKIIIGDIHDGVSGSITVISMLAGQEFAQEDEMRGALETIAQISADTARDVRLMMGAYDRESVTLEELSGDMRYIGNSYTAGRKIDFSHRCELCEKKDTLVDFAIYISLIHFFKECVVNTVKHSGADRAQSSLTIEDGILILEYEDSGVGLKDKKNGGYGLSTMQKRVDNVGGRLTMDGRDGLKIRAEIPFQR